MKYLTKLIFPETTRMELARREHWRHCDFAQHYQGRANKVGTYRVATQMRRQGFALGTALSVLIHRR